MLVFFFPFFPPEQALYFQLVDLMNSRFEQSLEQEISLKSSFENMQTMLRDFYDYRFFYVGFCADNARE